MSSVNLDLLKIRCYLFIQIAAMVDSGRIANMVLLDFSKAFDVVSHVVLIEKLRDLGVCAMLLR